MTSQDKREVFKALMNYGTLGLEMGISLVVGLGIGYYLDRYFGTSPILLILFMMFGLAAGMKRLYSLWKKAEQADERDDNERH